MEMPKPGAATVRTFEGLIPTAENVTVKKVFGHPAAFVNGNMFFGTFGTQIFVRLSDDDRAEAERAGGFAPFEPMPGRPMRGYLVVPSSVLADRTRARRWVTRALACGSALPTKKPGARSKR